MTEREDRVVARIEAVMRLLLDSGDITPTGVRQVLKVLEAEGYVTKR